MSSKVAGLTFLRYTQVCARAVRKVLKDDVRVQALRREEQSIKVAKWKDGKQGESAKTFGFNESAM
ncbi:mitochondrial ATP synthase epsilon chain domain-containing protein [Ramicandelaber brevisporus]|nr:mitochondrial ATP synthase epsilon chain domain-containing protein [Ramicandelaber brevisporus]KAI8869977.1 mitochondrial ATP synthase epsilon chain domain-containing protein [Ramicandelaber brevisporus]